MSFPCGILFYLTKHPTEQELLSSFHGRRSWNSKRSFDFLERYSLYVESIAASLIHNAFLFYYSIVWLEETFSDTVRHCPHFQRLPIIFRILSSKITYILKLILSNIDLFLDMGVIIKILPFLISSVHSLFSHELHLSRF